MTFCKWALLCVIVFMATAVSSAQQKFPLRTGEWVVTTAGTTPGQAPVVIPYCLNDDLWSKALTRNPACTITNYSVTLTGAGYNMSCSMTTFKMKGNVSIVFDGMMHMVARGSFDMMSAKTGVTHSNTQTDYRWKGPTCDPNTDVNLKINKQQQN